MRPFEDVMIQQKSWATSQGLEVDPRGYLSTVELNLRAGLSEAANAAFEHGSGGELRDAESRPAKMRSLHSSSALVVNVFDYWAGGEAKGLAGALGLQSGIRSVAFEAHFPTVLEGNPPNLDLALTLDDGTTIGIESKFTEWMMAKSTKHAPFKPKYFPGEDRLWEMQGLPACQKLARSLQAGAQAFHHLDGAQLLKHTLGLATQLSSKFSLWYIYFDWPCAEAEVHRAEIAEFSGLVGAELRFKASTYQVLYDQLRGTVGAEGNPYLLYLGGRYFPGATP